MMVSFHYYENKLPKNQLLSVSFRTFTGMSLLAIQLGTIGGMIRQTVLYVQYMDGNREFILMKMFNREMKFKNLLKVVSKTLSTAA